MNQSKNLRNLLLALFVLSFFSVSFLLSQTDSTFLVDYHSLGHKVSFLKNDIAIYNVVVSFWKMIIF